jgi:hypothetical protein
MFIIKNGLRDRLIRSVKEHTFKNKKRINLVGLSTLKRLNDSSLIIHTFKDKYPIRTRSVSKRYNYAIGYCFDENNIAFNEEYNWKNEDLLTLTCVHEINHTMNWHLYRRHKINFCYNEFLAKLAEDMYKNNTTILTRSKKNKIKKEMFNQYVNSRKHLNQNTLDKIKSYDVGILY